MECNAHMETRRVDMSEIPPRCHCGGILRPNAVFFGELIPQEAHWRSHQVATDCDVMLVIGTSAVVQPAGLMPVIAKESGAKIIEINPESTPLTGDISDYLIKGRAGDIMNGIVAELQKLI
jgi:NAD-dependent deacetylase